MRRALVLLAACWCDVAQAACRQALAIGMDVSGSVDASEYQLQLTGLANALTAPEVTAALLSTPDAPLRLFVFEWSGMDSQRRVLPWTELTDHGAIAAAAARIRATTRQQMELTTAIGAAMTYGATELNSQSECWRSTLDLSGDGKNNAGIRPRRVHKDPLLTGITINGLVIGADAPATGDQRQTEIGEIWAFYKEEVIRGHDAFIEVALGFQDFENAMTRKLLREMATLPVSRLERAD